MKNWFWLIMLIPYFGFSQEVKRDSLQKANLIIIADSTRSDSSKLSDGKGGKKKFFPVPKTATRLALIPGFGQIYNRDYWKVPIVYLAIGGGIYTYYLNSIKYKDFRTAYESFYDLSTGQLKPGFTLDTVRVVVRVRNLLNTESTYTRARRDAIERSKNYWRRNRNLAVVFTGLIYALSIIETNVAAHLKTFDLSDDLTLRVSPKLNQPMLRQPAPGIRLVFNFK